ncbi:hypothetical protein FE257_001081 [Aspergillus nanangensis]|uniref:DUF6594 domain-containing protein n=1 Tax=Aspergillus nanangensis TaxID=2582783 RepID=A0AAD4GWE6_ASPNN|nr:hypothetical protein FE257_001081 [Aspergillus nanangensis]
MTLEGYDKLAALLASEPTLQYFRRFATLNTKNILVLQAEIANLEDELKDIIEYDKQQPGEDNKKRLYPFSVWHLKDSLNEPNADKFQWTKFLELRELLNQYNQALLQQSELMRFRRPDKADEAEFRKWLDDPEGAARFFGNVPENEVWSKDNGDDLIVLCRKQDGVDHFTRFIYRRFIPWFHRTLGYRSEDRHDEEMGVWKYNDSKVKSFTYVISILISGLLPAFSIIVLYFLKSATSKLVVVFVYNMVFSLVLGFLVKARRAEIFAAAVAFAAVQVALITNAGGTGCCK